MTTEEKKLPEITTEIDHLVTVGELNEIKEWMEETKPLLKEYAERMMEKASSAQLISWHQVFEIEAVYCNVGEMPVIRISGMALDRAATPPRNLIFARAFVAEEDCVASRYILKQ